MPTIKTITPQINLLLSTPSPLSSDVGIIYGKNHTYLFDVGACSETLTYLHSLTGSKQIILSHFHQDHTANLKALDFHTIYGSKQSLKYVPSEKRTIENAYCVTEKLIIDDGIHLEIFPLPSTHAKGCLCLCVDHTYAFLGDAIYPATVHNSAAYNVQLLKSEIDFLQALDCPYFVISHGSHPIYSKSAVLRKLISCYNRRIPDNNYIFV